MDHAGLVQNLKLTEFNFTGIVIILVFGIFYTYKYNILMFNAH